MDKSDKVLMHIGIGDSFTINKEHWIIISIKDNEYTCKNKISGAVVKFNKDVLINQIK